MTDFLIGRRFFVILARNFSSLRRNLAQAKAVCREGAEIIDEDDWDEETKAVLREKYNFKKYQ